MVPALVLASLAFVGLHVLGICARREEDLLPVAFIDRHIAAERAPQRQQLAVLVRLTGLGITNLSRDLEFHFFLCGAGRQAHQGRHVDGSMGFIAHARNKRAHQKQQQGHYDKTGDSGKQNGYETFSTHAINFIASVNSLLLPA